MTKSKNYVIYRNNIEELRALQEDYRSMGRETKIEDNKLTVFAISQKPKKDKRPPRD